MASQRKSNGERVLVTGGCGFVGRYVVGELLSRGYEVATLDTFQDPKDSTDVKCYQADMRSNVVHTVVYEFKPHFVVHLAAVHYIPYCNNNPEETYSVNVTGTHNLLQALSLSDEVTCRVFLASSAAVYTPSDTPHSEDSKSWPSDIYGFSKKAMELSAMEWSDRSGVDVIIGRYFNMYGWGETTPHLIPVLIEQLDNKVIRLGNIDTRRDFVHVEDNARATCDLLEMKNVNSQIINLGSGISHSARNIIQMLGKITEKRFVITNDTELSTLMYPGSDRDKNEIYVVSDTMRMRKSDRPSLVADTTLAYTLGLMENRITLFNGLIRLVKSGIGPHMRDL